MYYEYNGLEFILEETIQTNENQMRKIMITDDFQKLIYGGDSQVVKVDTRQNGSF